METPRKISEDKDNSDSIESSENLRRIGKIVGFHGVRGHFKVQPASGDPDWLDDLEDVCLTRPAKPGEEEWRVIESARLQKSTVILKLAGIESRNEAELFGGRVLFARESDLPEPEDGEFWLDELIGLAVVDIEGGETLGVVKDLVVSGATDYVEIGREGTEQTVTVPYTPAFFPEVRLEEKQVVVQHVRELLDELS
ncbi:MAG: ribosome maturation factor RimM [Vampirovibrio sp.]|nr:ribosome maturation factor RimM [Vampirovibrio sp.]